MVRVVALPLAALLRIVIVIIRWSESERVRCQAMEQFGRSVRIRFEKVYKYLEVLPHAR